MNYSLVDWQGKSTSMLPQKFFHLKVLLYIVMRRSMDFVQSMDCPVQSSDPYFVQNPWIAQYLCKLWTTTAQSIPLEACGSAEFH